DHADHAARLDLDSLLVDRHRDPGEGILCLVPGVADGNARRLHGARFFPLLCFLGSDAGADVSADRHLGWPAQTLCGHQVLPLHAAGLRADAAGHPVPLFPSPHGYWRFHVPYSRALSNGAADSIPLRHLAVRCFLHWLRHQGSDVSVPYVAAGCPRGSAHRRLRYSGGRFAEDGNVRIRALFAAVLSRGRVPSQSAKLDDRHLARWHHLWSAGFTDAEGHEKAGGLLIRQPPGFLHAGNLCAEFGGPDRLGAAADQPRHLDRDAALCDDHDDHVPLVDGIAAAEWIRRRVYDSAGSIHRELEVGSVGGAGRGSGGGLLALALSARLLRYGNESQEREAA